MLPFYCWILLSLSAKISVRARTIKLGWLLPRCRLLLALPRSRCHFRQIGIMSFFLHFFLLSLSSSHSLDFFFSTERHILWILFCRFCFYYMNSMRLGKHTCCHIFAFSCKKVLCKCICVYKAPFPLSSGPFFQVSLVVALKSDC